MPIDTVPNDVLLAANFGVAVAILVAVIGLWWLIRESGKEE
jgi:hypothetical protein